MNHKHRLSGWQTGALMAALFLLSSSACFARGLFFFGGRYAASDFSDSQANPDLGGPVAGGHGDGNCQAGPQQGRQPQAYRQYRATFAPPMVPNYGSSRATDYLASVCKEGTYRWPSEKLPIKIWIGDGTGVPGYKPVFQSYVRNGFDAWCAASGNKLAWVEVHDQKQADITVGFTDKVTERPEGTEAGRTSAMTRLNTATGQGVIYGARMQFLTQLPTRRFADQEVEKTCLHEAGHALGLQGHSPYRTDIMYYAVGPSQKPMLTDRDCNTLAKLYASYPALDALAVRAKTSTASAADAAPNP